MAMAARPQKVGRSHGPAYTPGKPSHQDADRLRACLADPGAPPDRRLPFGPGPDHLQPHRQPAAPARGPAADHLRGCGGRAELRRPGGAAGGGGPPGGAVQLGQRRQLQPADGLPGGCPGGGDALPGYHRCPVGDGVLRWLHGPRQGLCAFLYLPGPVQQLDAGPGDQSKPAGDLCLLGAGGHVLLSAGGLLVRPRWRRPCRPESLCGEPGW